jgi:exodeoxyribonuclease-3
MRVATWNVNSIRPRLEHLATFLRSATPDVVCLQETKVEDAKFPEEAIGDMGYRATFFGQKTYNGVAILARYGLAVDDVQRNLEDDPEDAPRRLLACTVDGVRIVDVYVPNGQAVGTTAFAYKLAWLGRLERELARKFTPADRVLVCGDFNVAPDPIDVHDPSKWEGQVLFSTQEREAIASLRGSLGFVDAWRERHPDEASAFTWWDYRMGAFRRNMGLRIDHVIVTRPLFERCTEALIDKAPRTLERPSDHTPVVVDLDV